MNNPHLSQSIVLGDLVKKLQGKVLTVVEASYSDIEQRSAVKSIVKQVFNETWEPWHRALFPTEKYDQPIGVQETPDGRLNSYDPREKLQGGSLGSSTGSSPS